VKKWLGAGALCMSMFSVGGVKNAVTLLLFNEYPRADRCDAVIMNSGRASREALIGGATRCDEMTVGPV